MTLTVTQSPFLAGLVDAAFAAPLFASFAVGAWVDSVAHKKRVALLASGVRCAGALALVGAISSGRLALEVGTFIGVAFGIGFVSDIQNSVRATWFRASMRRAEYQRGVAANQIVNSVAQAGGLTLAGSMLIFGSYLGAWAFVGMFALVLVPIAVYQGSDQSGAAKGNLSHSLRDGIVALRTCKELRQAILPNFGYNLLLGMSAVFEVVFVQRWLHLSALYVAFLSIALLLALLVGTVSGPVYRGRLGPLIVGLFFTIGVALVGFLALPDYWYALCAFGGIGFMLGFVGVSLNAAILEVIPNGMMGRISGLFNSLGPTASVLAGVSAGVLLTLLQAPQAFAILGLASVAMAVWTLALRELNAIQVGSA